MRAAARSATISSVAATVLIVDDHAGFRSFARALLEAEGFGARTGGGARAGARTAGRGASCARVGPRASGPGRGCRRSGPEPHVRVPPDGPHAEITEAATLADGLTALVGVHGYEPPEGTALLAGSAALLRSNGLVVAIHASDEQTAIAAARSLQPYSG
jgi:CheY-like chemotaxis protein